MRKLDGRVAVVTGAASGIGRGTSLALADKGCDLALADVNEAGLKETAAEVEARGRHASVHVVDVAQRAQVQALAGEVIAEHGHVHVLVNTDEDRERAAQQFARIGMDPRKAGRKIVRAIERDKPRLRIRPESYVADWMARLAPNGTQRLLGFLWRRRLGAPGT